jgi:hypothetical protein
LLSQLCSFSGEGSVEHDDYVDSTAQAIRLIADKFKITTTPPKDVDDVEYEPRKIRRNPYAV